MRIARQIGTAVEFAGVLRRAREDYRKSTPANSFGRAQWLQRWSGEALKALRVDLIMEGAIPSNGLLVANHLSYLDVLVLGAIAPASFVSKSEVAGWPVVGSLTQMAGTIFLRRESRKSANAANNTIAERLQRGDLVVFFPEGTSSDGSTVLPFHAALFEPAITAGVPVQSAHIAYDTNDADPATDVCYWGSMTFATHLWRLFGIKRTRAYVRFGVPSLYADRKTAARATREVILAISAGA